MRKALFVVAAVLLAFATPADAWSKCSVCEWLVNELVGKGTCDGAKDLCGHLDVPWDAVCAGIVDCCCSTLINFIQRHLGDASRICHDVHMCSTLSKGEIFAQLAAKAQRAAAAENPSGPQMPPQLACNAVGATWDARDNSNFTYAATTYDSFATAVRRADFSTFGVRGTRWITNASGTAPQVYEMINGTCTQRKGTDGVAPFASEANFWVNATYEGQELRSLIGPVDKFTRFAPQGYFVGYFRPWDKRPAEVWAFYKSHFRTVETISGTADSFPSSLVAPCTP